MALTSELSIRFLRPCIGEVLWGRATIDTAGRRNIVGTVRIWTDANEGKPSAVAQGTYVLPAA
jgi:acyl-coenzyme A thioesterase PaaI-like protein